MIGVCVIPTGIRAEIGGNAGDGNAVAKLLASTCDTLIVHPNVVNAADINEMTENMLYVEGSMLDRFLWGNIGLDRVKSNKILLVTNPPLRNEVVNSVSAARVTLGAEIEVLILEKPLKMVGRIENGKATGDVIGWENLVKQAEQYKFDAIAIHTPIELDRETRLNYYRNGGVNPWGGVEAMTSKLIGRSLNKPAAHAPVENIDPDDKELYTFNEIVDPRIAPELVSVCYLHCILKGLHKAPRIGTGLTYKDIDFMVTPIGCVGPPHHACLKHGIPIIAVKENKTCLNDKMPDSFIFVENYLEAVGVINAMKIGISLESVRRPIKNTKIHGLHQ